MKICIPMEGTTVSQHFGHTPEFLILTVQDGKITDRETFKSPGHEPGLLPKMMAEFGITHVIAGGMGRRAQEMFEERKIRVYSGVSGSTDEAARLLIEGKLTSGENLCDH